jgi:hypothetical protein
MVRCLSVAPTRRTPGAPCGASRGRTMYKFDVGRSDNTGCVMSRNGRGRRSRPAVTRVEATFFVPGPLAVTVPIRAGDNGIVYAYARYRVQKSSHPTETPNMPNYRTTQYGRTPETAKYKRAACTLSSRQWVLDERHGSPMPPKYRSSSSPRLLG